MVLHVDGIHTVLEHVGHLEFRPKTVAGIPHDLAGKPRSRRDPGNSLPVVDRCHSQAGDHCAVILPRVERFTLRLFNGEIIVQILGALPLKIRMCQFHPVIGKADHDPLAGGRCPRFTDVEFRAEDGSSFGVPILKRPLQRKQWVIRPLGQARHFLHWPPPNRVAHLHAVAQAKRLGCDQCIPDRTSLEDEQLRGKLPYEFQPKAGGRLAKRLPLGQAQDDL